jgi:Ca-activated chloride channel homolog
VSFAAPLWLLALALAPAALAARRIARRRARRYAMRFPAVATLRTAVAADPSRRSLLPLVALLAAVAALVGALARPRVSSAVVLRRASIVLVLDHSGSMQARDVQPTRLAAAKHAALQFLDALPVSVRVGFVAFSSSPNALLAPTTDRAAVRAALVRQRASGSTATGSALAAAIGLLREHGKPAGRAAIVLLSDGAANSGQNPVAIARAAAHRRIAIDTVALGTASGTVPGADPFAAPIPVPPDPQLMKRIAHVSHGRSFDAEDASTLDSIYRDLGTRLSSRRRWHDLTPWFAAGGLALLAAAMLAAVRFGVRSA